MLRAHINAIEDVLLAQSRAAANAGHPNLRGGPREWFIRDFLSTHLPSTLEVGQGEIIDAQSLPSPPRGQYRPQVDVVLYRRDLPKISFSTTDYAFLAEGVMATIEVKSNLDQIALQDACRAATVHKSLQRNIGGAAMGGGWMPKYIVSYVVAFDGPANMSTVAGWMPGISQTLQAASEHLVDMVVLLGRGLLWYIDAFPSLQPRTVPANHHWAFVDQADQNLFTFFIHMLSWMGWTSSPPNVLGYARSLALRNVGTF